MSKPCAKQEVNTKKGSHYSVYLPWTTAVTLRSECVIFQHNYNV